jgi:hypothetical protein
MWTVEDREHYVYDHGWGLIQVQQYEKVGKPCRCGLTRREREDADIRSDLDTPGTSDARD